jgi:hypothetical protein
MVFMLPLTLKAHKTINKIFFKMNKYKLIFFLLLMLPFGVYAQKSVTEKKEISKTPNLKLAYLGAIIYPGFKVGVEFPRYAKEKTITKKSGAIKTKLKERFITANFSMYHHPKVHTNLMLLGEWQMRKTRQNGWFTEFAPGLGISHTFLAATTYQANEVGAIEKVNLAGNNYFLTSLSGGFGYDFQTKKEKPIKVYARGSLVAHLPFANLILPKPTIEIGVIKSFSSFKK